MNTVSLSLKKVSRAVLWSHRKDSIAVKAGKLMVVSENILRLTTIKETLCISARYCPEEKLQMKS